MVDRDLKHLAEQQMRRPPRRTKGGPGIVDGEPRLVHVNLYIETAADGHRKLVARYETGGGDDLPVVDGLREFATSIPDDWTYGRIMNLINGPTTTESPYDVWEVPARVYGFLQLFDEDSPPGQRP